MNDSYKAKSEDLKNLLLQYRKFSRKQVEDTKNRYNQRIREYIRDETRLKLDGAQVRIVISDDFSPIFRKIIQDKERQFWEIFINLNLLKETSHGLMFLNEKLSLIPDLLPEETHLVKSENIIEIKNFIDNILKFFDRRDFWESFKTPLDKPEKNEISEVLGAYFFHENKIVLYWPSITIIAITLDISIESLTVVTLIHELTHAYTHLGKDSDSLAWNTEDFCKTHLFILEGIAQFYTERICKDKFSDMSDIYNAFKELLKYQGEAYTSYTRWVDNKKHEVETIRSSMIICSHKPIHEFNEFMAEVKDIEQRFKTLKGKRLK